MDCFVACKLCIFFCYTSAPVSLRWPLCLYNWHMTFTINPWNDLSECIIDNWPLLYTFAPVSLRIYIDRWPLLYTFAPVSLRWPLCVCHWELTFTWSWRGRLRDIFPNAWVLNTDGICSNVFSLNMFEYFINKLPLGSKLFSLILG